MLVKMAYYLVVQKPHINMHTKKHGIIQANLTRVLRLSFFSLLNLSFVVFGSVDFWGVVHYRC